ncbi:MAG: hypothetical protein GXO65_06525 [Euryarchaeota archaeon]|nr:hypothetical protein [Euryarchaeota archaeon]
MEKTPTGIAGLDEMLDGGIPTGYTVLVSGGPGSGKSTFAMQFLTNGKEMYGEDGVYITMDERPSEIDRNFAQYGWDLSKIMLLGLNIRQATDTTEVKYTTLDEDKREHSNIIELDVKKISVDSLKDFITDIEDKRQEARGGFPGLFRPPDAERVRGPPRGPDPGEPPPRPQLHHPPPIGEARRHRGHQQVRR